MKLVRDYEVEYGWGYYSSKVEKIIVFGPMPEACLQCHDLGL